MENRTRNTNWLANFFYWVYEVLKAADEPIFLVIAVLLPFVAPLLPALITSDNLQKFMGFPPSWQWIGVITFEFIGILGAIAMVRAAMALSQNTDEKKTSALQWNRSFFLGVYLIYLFSLIVSNLVVEIANNTPVWRVLVTACFTIGVSIAAAMLNASRIYEREESKERYSLRQERREDRLKAKALEAGINIFSAQEQSRQFGADTSQAKPQKSDWRLLTDQEKHEVRNVLTVEEIMQKYPIRRSTAFGWKSKND